jgi:hypothetical protein
MIKKEKFPSSFSSILPITKIGVNPVRNSSGALNPAVIIEKI